MLSPKIVRIDLLAIACLALGVLGATWLLQSPEGLTTRAHYRLTFAVWLTSAAIPLVCVKLVVDVWRLLRTTTIVRVTNTFVEVTTLFFRQRRIAAGAIDGLEVIRSVGGDLVRIVHQPAPLQGSKVTKLWHLDVNDSVLKALRSLGFTVRVRTWRWGKD